MKIKKNGKQQNTELNWSYYETTFNVLTLLKEEKIGFIDEKFMISFNVKKWLNSFEENQVDFDHHYPLRVFFSDVKELKLVYNNQNGMYENIAILNDNTIVHVCL